MVVIQNLNWLWILLVVLTVGACGDDLSKDPDYGLVEMFHGKPVPPKVMPRSLLGSTPTGPFESHQLQGIMVMDSGADYTGQSSMTYISELLERYNPEGRGDLPVHYFIDQDGVIYAGRHSITPAKIFENDAFTKRSSEIEDEADLIRTRMARFREETLDLDGYIVIMFLGDYDTQLVTKEQEKAFFQLVSHQLFRHNMPRESIVLLSSLHPETGNPGFYLKNYLNWSTLEKNLPPPPAKHRFLNMPNSQ